MARVISAFEPRFVGMSKIRKTCDNCYEKKELAQMSNDTFVCLECSKDVEAITNRLPPTSEKK